MELVCLLICFSAMAALTVPADRPVFRIKQDQIGSCLGSSTLEKGEILVSFAWQLIHFLGIRKWNGRPQGPSSPSISHYTRESSTEPVDS